MTQRDESDIYPALQELAVAFAERERAEERRLVEEKRRLRAEPEAAGILRQWDPPSRVVELIGGQRFELTLRDDRCACCGHALPTVDIRRVSR
jgi:hypothetical protein